MSAIKDILDDPAPEPPPQQAPATSPLPTRGEEPARQTPPPADSAPVTAEEQTTPPKDAVYTSTTASTRRNASGSVSSVYSGNKMKHLKKEDGIPLWRKDIQYDFLHLVFHDDHRCFTKYSDGTTGHTFAEIYIDAMAKSSKCSKILKDKLLQDTEGRIGMAMVCLLVNVGRMNTTLNFFPEMRAQLRTYHSIPALQAHQEPNAYKQLQDAPRLKSILKGATEDEPQPSTIEEIKAANIPRTNPVNLIFVMSQYAPKISEVHFQPPRDFFDLVMRSTLSSKSRATAFLWLLWWYLESDFTYEASQNNPFGPGQFGEGEKKDAHVMPLKVPTLESLTEEQAALENVDTEEERYYGEVKKKERTAILASEPSPAMTAARRPRKEKGLVSSGVGQALDSEDELSDSMWRTGGSTFSSARRQATTRQDTISDYTRSPSPNGNWVGPKPLGDMRINNLLNNEDAMSEMSPPAAPPKKGPGRGNWRRNRPKDAGAVRPQDERGHPVPLLPNPNHATFAAETSRSTPLTTTRGNLLPSDPPDTLDGAPGPTASYHSQKRFRGLTQHQSAINSHRKQQVDYNLDRRIRKLHDRARDKREVEGAILRAWARVRVVPVDYDSEEEAIRSRKVRDRVDKGEDVASLPKGKENVDGIEDIEARMRPRVLYAGFVRAPDEANDVGEELRGMAGAMRKCGRRLERWDENTQPGLAMREWEQGRASRESRRARIMKEPSMEEDGMEIVPAHQSPRAKKAKGRGGKGKGAVKRAERRAERRSNQQSKPDPMDLDQIDGAAELDDVDRELLGEVDADESETYEDEVMGEDT